MHNYSSNYALFGEYHIYFRPLIEKIARFVKYKQEKRSEYDNNQFSLHKFNCLIISTSQ